MSKNIVVLATILVISSLWGYTVGMLDYRLMINTAATCTCWIKFAALMAFTTFIVAVGSAFYLVKKTNFFEPEQPVDISGNAETPQ